MFQYIFSGGINNETIKTVSAKRFAGTRIADTF